MSASGALGRQFPKEVSYDELSKMNHGFAKPDGDPVAPEMVHDYVGDLTGKDPENVRFRHQMHIVNPSDDPGPDSWHDQANVKRLANVYRAKGPTGLPPISFAGGSQIDGHHRIAAAARAGLTWVPSYHAIED